MHMAWTAHQNHLRKFKKLKVPDPRHLFFFFKFKLKSTVIVPWGGCLFYYSCPLSEMLGAEQGGVRADAEAGFLQAQLQ